MDALPADEVDDGVVLEGGVGGALTSSLIRQLHHVIFVRELPIGLATAQRSVGVFYAHRCDKKNQDFSTYICVMNIEWKR